MRLKIRLNAFNSDRLPVNYNYPLSSAIYKLLRFGSPEFSEYLHDVGYKLEGKSYKLFTFALRFYQYQMAGKIIKLNSPRADLIVSSPLIDDFIRNFILGSFKSQVLELYGEGITSAFTIEQMEALPDIDFAGRQKFRTLSPLVLSTVKENEGRRSQYFFRYHDNINDINRVINSNLRNKYKLLYNKAYEGEPLTFEWDNEFINRKLSGKKRLTKMISISRPKCRPINIIGNDIPFYLSGDPALMNVGYQCGFGEKNSMGMGLTQISNPH